MNYREVTKDDVGKMVEVRDAGTFKDGHSMQLEHILSTPSDGDFRYLTWGKTKGMLVCWKHARIRNSPLSDGWLPDDWRVLGDEEVCQRGDAVITKSMPTFQFSDRLGYAVVGKYIGMTAKQVVDRVDCNLCVVRPRWRPATKDDQFLTVNTPDGKVRLCGILDTDPQGRDCLMYVENTGWCLGRLADLKIENEGWHVKT